MLGEQKTFDMNCIRNYYNRRGDGEDLRVGDEEDGLQEQSEAGLSVVDVPQASDFCAARGRVRTSRISEQDLADTILNLVHLSGLDEEDREFLNLLGQDSLFSLRYYQGLFLDSQNDQREVSLFEKVFDKVRSDTFPLTISRSYYRQFFNMGEIMFPLPEDLVCNVKGRFQNFMNQSYFEPLDRLVQEVQRREAQIPQVGALRIPFEVGRDYQSLDLQGRVSYLSSRKLEDHRVSVHKYFHEETAGFYLGSEISTQDGRRYSCARENE
jgi:hypothetical protein